MTTPKEKLPFYKSLKFKVFIFILFIFSLFYCLCFLLTTSQETTKELETERILTNDKKRDINSIRSIDSTYLKDINTRREELKTKLLKEKAGLLFLTKSELLDFLNENQGMANFQKYAEYRIDGEFLTMNVFYPVSELTFLKFLPGISSRTFSYKLIIQPVVQDNVFYANVKGVKLPKWANPIFISNVFWPIKVEDEWKYLKKISITEFGVFLIFEQKIESGR